MFKCTFCNQTFDKKPAYEDANHKLCEDCNNDCIAFDADLNKYIEDMPKKWGRKWESIESLFNELSEWNSYYRIEQENLSQYYDPSREQLEVYVIYNKTKRKYYVGESKANIYDRIASHFKGRGNKKIYEDYKAGDKFVYIILVHGDKFKCSIGYYCMDEDDNAIICKRTLCDLLDYREYRGKNKTVTGELRYLYGYNHRGKNR